MGRIHLFEFEDQSWFPKFLRNYGTDFLRFLSNKTKIWNPVLPILKKGLERAETYHILDLASGGGGGILALNTELQKNIPELKITLTDYFPNISAFQLMAGQASNINFIEESIDAKNVPPHLEGLRTQFLSLHHFRPDDAKQILQSAVDYGRAIAIFEAQERSLPSILAMLISPVSVLLTTPFIRPFKWGRILFTYFIPIVPLFVLWDGVVSSLRTYSVKEMKDLVGCLRNKDSYHWEINRLKSTPGVILYLLGTKKK